jgi:hypothetical protein
MYSTYEEWISVLRVAHRFGFVSMRAFAIKHLSSFTSSVDRIVLARKFGVGEWLELAYIDICIASEFISDADIHQFGPDLFMKIARARGRHKLFTPSAELDVPTVIEEAFQPKLFGTISDPLPTTPEWPPAAIKHPPPVLVEEPPPAVVVAPDDVEYWFGSPSKKKGKK